jgi:hypothetical protein
MDYLWSTVASLAMGGVMGVAGATAGFRWSIRQMDKAVQSMSASARTIGLTAQRLIGEVTLVDGLIRDVAHYQGLHLPDPAHDDGVPDDLVHGMEFEFLEGEDR